MKSENIKMQNDLDRNSLYQEALLILSFLTLTF